MSLNVSTLQVRPVKKIVVRKAGTVRLTSAANAAYFPGACFPV